MVRDRLRGWPEDVPINGAPPQVRILQEISAATESYPSPFPSAAKRLDAAARDLEAMAPLDVKAGPLVHPPYQWKPDLDRDVAKWGRRIREAAERCDPGRYSQAVKGLRSSLRTYRTLVDSTQELRKHAIEAIRPASESGDVYPEHGWLEHGPRSAIWDENARVELRWSPWDVLSQPDLLDMFAELIAAEIKHRGTGPEGWAFDLVCPMSSTAMPLATSLSIRFKSRLVAINDDDGRRFPPGSEPRNGDRALLVDSLLQTGRHSHEAWTALDAKGTTIAAAVFICENDRLPPGQDQFPIVQVLKRQERFLALFRMSDLLTAYRQRGAEAESLRSS